jgi:hypothetical protein
MILGVLLVGCLPSDVPPSDEPDTTSQTFEEGWTPEADSIHLNPRITCSADPTPANVANAVRGVNIVNPNVVLINPPQGAWLSFNQGGAVGRYLQIVSVDAATLKLTLLVNAEGSHVGIDFHGPVYCSRLMNNTVTGTQSYQYGSDNHLRVTSDRVSPQSSRVTTLADMPVGAMTPRPHVGLASYNSVVNNQVGWDVSFHTRDMETWRGIPAYASANTSANGVADYNDGSYVFLTSDPNP